MFEAYAIPALFTPEDPAEARARQHRLALREAMIAAKRRRPAAGRLRAALASGRRADIAACCA